MGMLAGFAQGLHEAPEVDSRRRIQEQNYRKTEQSIDKTAIDMEESKFKIQKLQEEVFKVKAENDRRDMYRYFDMYEASDGKETKYLQMGIEKAKKSEFIGEHFKHIARVDQVGDEDILSADKRIKLEQSGEYTPEQVQALVDSNKSKYLKVTQVDGKQTLMGIPELYASSLYAQDLHTRSYDRYTKEAKLKSEYAKAKKDEADAVKMTADAGKIGAETNKLNEEVKKLQAYGQLTDEILADPNKTPEQKLSAIKGNLDKIRGNSNAFTTSYEFIKNMADSGQLPPGIDGNKALGGLVTKETTPPNQDTAIKKNIDTFTAMGVPKEEALNMATGSKANVDAELRNRTIANMHKEIPLYKGKELVPNYLEKPDFEATKFFAALSKYPDAEKKVRDAERKMSLSEEGKKMMTDVGSILDKGLSALGSNLEQFDKATKDLKDKDGTFKYNFVDGLLGKITQYFGLPSNPEKAKEQLTKESFQRELINAYRTLLLIQSGQTVGDKEAAEMVRSLGSIYSNPRIAIEGMSSKLKGFTQAIHNAGEQDRPLYNIKYKKMEENYRKIISSLDSNFDGIRNPTKTFKTKSGIEVKAGEVVVVKGVKYKVSDTGKLEAVK